MTLMQSASILLGMVIATAASASVGAQPASISRRPGLGLYAGLVSEMGRFDGGNVNAAEEESGHIGVFVGRWSLGYTSKLLSQSVVVLQPGAPIRITNLQVSGMEVGRLLRRRGPLQLAGFATVGRGRVKAAIGSSGASTAPTVSGTTFLIEPAVSAGVALGPILHVDVRAGVRLGGSVNVSGQSIGTSGGFVGLTWALGWLGDWRMRGW